MSNELNARNLLTISPEASAEPQAHRYAGLFPMIEPKEFEELKADIKQHGLLQPIYLYENQILDGRNRHKACIELGITPRFEEYKGNAPLDFVISLNLKRRHLTSAQMGCVAVDALPLFREEAKKRQQAAGGAVPQKIGEAPHEGEATQKAAKTFNTNRTYINTLANLKETKPDVFTEVKNGIKTMADVHSLEWAEKKAAQLEKIKTLEPPKGKYNLIVCDPPWDTLGNYDPIGFHGGATYPTMTIDQIKKIPIAELSDENTILWLWVIDSALEFSFDIIKTWGFERKATLVWHKTGPIGLGNWLRVQHEYCFLCVKGKPVFHGENFKSVLEAPRRSHSEKPDEFYQLIVEASPYPAKLDYFARKKREGWEAYGDEIAGGQIA